MKELKVEERHKHYPEPVSTVSNTIKVEGANTGEKMLAVIVGNGLILSWQVSELCITWGIKMAMDNDPPGML